MNQTQDKRWFMNTWFICLLFACWFFIIPPIIGIILIFKKNSEERQKENIIQQTMDKNTMLIQQKEKTIQQIMCQNAMLMDKNTQLNNSIVELGVTDYQQAKEKLDSINIEISENLETIDSMRTEISLLQQKDEKLQKAVLTQEKKLSRSKELYNSIDYAMNNFINADLSYQECRITQIDLDDLEMLVPSVTLKLHCMDIKSLRKAFHENEKAIDTLRKQYSTRYTTKSNKTIYDLIVKGLESEMQNVLYNLKYDKLDIGIEQIKDICSKYLMIAAGGNQTIAGTLTKFIGEMEYLFINAAKIEYNYYVKKEQAKQEQLAIKEQMRQEAEERKALEAERKKVELEESKYENQILALKEQAETSEGDALAALQARILELQAQLADVTIKKDEITKLQNGKAGNVYIISNLGSFGENVFKIGMTRRINPQDRVNELGDASVPFKFDVHSFIFSDDASGLETELHKRLNDCRVNKVNLRKEFFNVSIDELETLVNEICPTAEFNRTMLAEEYRQSQSTSEVYTSDYSTDEVEDEDYT